MKRTMIPALLILTMMTMSSISGVYADEAATGTTAEKSAENIKTEDIKKTENPKAEDIKKTENPKAEDIKETESSKDEDIKETESKETETIAGLVFTGPATDLTLDRALTDALTSGASIKAAEIQKQADAANAKVNAESLSKMNATNKDENSSNTYSKSEMDKVKKATDYYSTMADRNFEAAKNAITYKVNNAYYSLLNAEEGVRIAKENVTLQKNLLTLVNEKLSLGVASKQDVLNAEMNLNNAQSALSSAEVSLAEKKIAFNNELGYEDMQRIRLTSELSLKNISALSVDTAITDAVAKRNELYTSAFNIYTAEKELNNYTAYPKSSAKYLTALNNYHSAQNSYNSKEDSIKKEVRINYANMMNSKVLAENSKLSAGKAKESYEINLSKYKLGLATLSEVQQAQISWAEGEKSYAESILNCNLAIITYELSATVGMSSAI
ncbi:MAG: hypothetical protein K0Q48_1020 [Bacillota bacterium]|nr:hypothetical protein [Bacillota bacterium]